MFYDVVESLIKFMFNVLVLIKIIFLVLLNFGIKINLIICLFGFLMILLLNFGCEFIKYKCGYFFMMNGLLFWNGYD